MAPATEQQLTDLFCQQSQLGEDIIKEYTNYGKLPLVERAKLAVVSARIIKVCELFSQFKKNDDILSGVTERTYEYFQKGYFDRIEKLHNESIVRLLADKENIEKAVPSIDPRLLPSHLQQQSNDTLSNQMSLGENNKSGSSTKSQGNLTELTKKIQLQVSACDILGNKLERIKEKLDQGLTGTKLELTYENLSTQWNQIVEQNKVIFAWSTGLEGKLPLEYSLKDFALLEDEVEEVMSLLICKKRKDSIVINEPSNSPPIQVPFNLAEDAHRVNKMVHLPKVDIPKFNGNILQWNSFKNLFVEMIEKAPISESQKLFYLKSNLTGDAANLVAMMELNLDTYKDAWERLRSKYENDRVLTSALAERLFSQPSLKEESASGLRNLREVTKECLSSRYWYLLLKKFDGESRKQFEFSMKKPKENPTLKDFYDFLEIRCQCLESLGRIPKIGQKVVHSHVTANVSGNCPCCTENHALIHCKKFAALIYIKKWNVIRKNRICCKCFSKGHFGNECEKPGCSKEVSGKMCGKNHHPLLHKEEKVGGKVSLTINELYFSAPEDQDEGFVFMGTALIKLKDGKGKYVACRALIDSGSQVNLITKTLSNKLALPLGYKPINIYGAGNKKSTSHERINLEVFSQDHSVRFNLEALVLSLLTSYQPSGNIDFQKFISSDIVLADPEFHCPNSIDMLLGAGIFPKIIREGMKSLGKGLPDLVNTAFGWVVMGSYEAGNDNDFPFCGSISQEELDFSMNAPRLWDLEEPLDRPLWSLEEQTAEKLFEETCVRDESGKFIVKLPKLASGNVLGDSYKIAYQRFLYLEKRLSKNKDLFDKYYEFLNEYLVLGHMVKTSWDEIPANHYFVPHHAVFKLDSSTTKTRVVFDASCKTSSNVSFNNILMKGPVLQDDIFQLLCRFRFFKYAMSADIEKMYRQIWVAEEDQVFQLILWRNSPEKEIGIYKLKTVTYGTTSAPYLATKCLQTVGKESSSDYPITSNVILNDFYVDDLITGSNDIQEALKIQKELNEILASYGFHLRKWTANNQALLENVPESDKEFKWSPKMNSETVKTLGVKWQPFNDSFSLVIADFPSKSKITKRVVTSEAGSVFDPQGLINPVVVNAKLIIQEIWKRKLDWDNELPDELNRKWEQFRKDLKELPSIEIPRYLLCEEEPVSIELHGFSDASERAYGACVYVRSVGKTSIHTQLLCSRSKVASLSKTTIPRLELAGAKLLAELMSKVVKSIRVEINKIVYWVDSEIVLWWIKKPSVSFKPFVGNRIAVIHELSTPDQWKHVPGELNPADIISRGMRVQDLKLSELWFNGPQFLRLNDSSWPQKEVFSALDNSDAAKSEIKKTVVSHVTQSFSADFNILDINHRNSFKILRRVVAVMLIFIRKCKKGNVVESRESREPRYKRLKLMAPSKLRDEVLYSVDPWTVEELSESETTIILCMQQAFDLHNRFKEFRKLLPFIDSKGLMRVGGRLKRSSLPFNAKHQIFLPDCKLTELLMIEIHIDNHHCAPQTLLSIALSNYWVINGKRRCSKIFYNCIKCFRSKPRDIFQLMGELPPERTELVAPFTHTGVDFAGPFMIHFKIRGKRPSKAYLAVFVCFAVKAVHLEVVSDLTTDAFIGCLKRFIARRGKPSQMYSDNGTNFVGAKNELQKLSEFFQLNSRKMFEYAASRGVKWSTIPARSPHFGGLWEASVKRAKLHLQHLVNNGNLTFEELNTVVIEVEAILNSRPLTTLSSCASDIKALTPNDFLIMGEASMIPDKDLSNQKDQLLKRWERVSKIRHEFWNRWSSEYLTTLQQRSKWLTASNNVRQGDMVVIKANLPPMQWELGRIDSVIKGNDNLVRVVDVKTSNGIKRRSISQICPLPISGNSEESPNCPDKDLEQLSRLPRKRKNQCSKPSSFTGIVKNTLITLIYILLILPKAFCTFESNNVMSNVNVSNFENHPGIYFDGIGKINIAKDKWHVVTYFNLSDYWTQCKNFNAILKNVEMLCKEDPCINTINELQRQVDDIETLNILVKEECHVRELTRSNYLQRHRRSSTAPLNVIGNIAHSLFGVLDNTYAEQLEGVITNVKSNEDRMMTLIKNHTTIIDNTVNIVKQNYKEIEANFKKLYDESQLILATQKKESKKILFNTLVNYMSLILSKTREMQLQIHSMMIDFKRGRLNPILINSVDFESHLKDIESKIGIGFKLPSTRYAELETVAELAVVHGPSSLIFQIEIPLLRTEDFNIYRMIPVPTFQDDRFIFIKPISEFLAINLKLQQYYLLSASEYDKCTDFFDIKVCFQHKPLFPANNDNHCEVNFFLQNNELTHHCDIRYGYHTQYWIELYKQNQWLFAMKNEVTMKIFCNEDTYMHASKLSGEGILEIGELCTIDVNGIRIPGKKDKYSNLILKSSSVSILPSINISANMVFKESNNPLILNLDNLDSISASVSKIKAEESIPLDPVEFKYHPQFYSFISFGLIAVIIVVVFAIVLYMKCCLHPSIKVQRRTPKYTFEVPETINFET